MYIIIYSAEYKFFRVFNVYSERFKNLMSIFNKDIIVKYRRKKLKRKYF